MSSGTVGQWVLLSYRMPREPSTPRITVWRKLKRIGVAQLGDGLVALPADARTREHLDWIAEEVLEADGSAMVWLAQPASLGQERQIAQGMADARAAEYDAVLADAEQASALPEPERMRVMRRLRDELRRIHRRDYFPPPQRQAADRAVARLHPEHRATEEETA
ncbi:Chromate resistance protein ChrB [Lentzea sp. BCCO 10_0798]|uniref:Chromate resistance protein ChrB n=1 Tax=Lentzea kristufekii TaxID=3095430 RepID=A0ABU4TJW5_9PSEU|nr:Chromate resistance protein ChrB [Lentzea sp. BCCO 10_0798]MDX8048495.1 Chromate resistance protein ChrB [Lentzea sp. BCCO 10_0798]